MQEPNKVKNKNYKVKKQEKAVFYFLLFISGFFAWHTTKIDDI